MTVHVVYAAQLAGAAGCMAEMMDVDAGATPRDVLEPAAVRHGAEFRRLAFTDAGDVQPTLLVAVDGEQVRDADGAALRDHYAAIRGGARDAPTFWWALTLELWLRRYHAM